MRSRSLTDCDGEVKNTATARSKCASPKSGIACGHGLHEQTPDSWESVSRDPIAEDSSPEAVFCRFLRRRHYRYTPQRRAIVAVFWTAHGHLTIDELFVRVHEAVPSVGQSTVYRTMRLLCEAGLAREVNFGRGVIRYERAGGWNHDHFLCEQCGCSIEFVDSSIASIGRKLARRYGFVLRQHRLYLYGLCSQCRAAEKKKTHAV